MFWQHHVSSSPGRSQQDVADDGESPEESTASGGYGIQTRSDDVQALLHCNGDWAQRRVWLLSVNSSRKWKWSSVRLTIWQCLSSV
jgi:hypothetical protein